MPFRRCVCVFVFSLLPFPHLSLHTTHITALVSLLCLYVCVLSPPHTHQKGFIGNKCEEPMWSFVSQLCRDSSEQTQARHMCAQLCRDSSEQAQARYMCPSYAETPLSRPRPDTWVPLFRTWKTVSSMVPFLPILGNLVCLKVRALIPRFHSCFPFSYDI